MFSQTISASKFEKFPSEFFSQTCSDFFILCTSLSSLHVESGSSYSKPDSTWIIPLSLCFSIILICSGFAAGSFSLEVWPAVSLLSSDRLSCWECSDLRVWGEGNGSSVTPIVCCSLRLISTVKFTGFVSIIDFSDATFKDSFKLAFRSFSMLPSSALNASSNFFLERSLSLFPSFSSLSSPNPKSWLAIFSDSDAVIISFSELCSSGM